MWTHHTETQHGWKYSIVSDSYVVRITGGSIAIFDRETQTLLKRYSGHSCLYTGDISPDESRCFALENGKHFYVYSLIDYALIRRVALPRGYECIDMYGHYTEDGRFICIPVEQWVGDEATGIGRYEYRLCRYETEQLTLVEMNVIENPESYRWNDIDFELLL